MYDMKKLTAFIEWLVAIVGRSLSESRIGHYHDSAYDMKVMVSHSRGNELLAERANSRSGRPIVTWLTVVWQRGRQCALLAVISWQYMSS
jgi:hypothetical protein